MAKKTPQQYEAVRLTAKQPYRAVFLNVLEPKAAPLEHGKAKPVFSATFLIKPEDPLFCGEGKSIQRLCLAVAKEEFNTVYTEALRTAKAKGAVTAASVLAELRIAGVTLPFDRGEDINARREKSDPPKTAYSWAPGNIMFRTSSNNDKDDAGNYKYQPRLGSTESGKGVFFDRDGLAIHGSMFYPGAECFFVVQFAGFAIKENDGTVKRYIKAYLEKVFVTGKGEKMGNGGADEFDQYLGKTTNESPVDELADVL